MSTRKKQVTKIEVVEEPEIQYQATPALFDEIKAWLIARGGIEKKSERDFAMYYDTKNYRLLREGIEYRIKQKGDQYRHDMKTPRDTSMREVLPDENDILWRNEIKFKTPKAKPSLSVFFAQSILQPVKARVQRFFDKELMEQFESWFHKHKFDHDSVCGRARVEFSFQMGYMETPDKSRRTQIHHILELELREGLDEGLLEEKRALEAEFFPKGLILLKERKIMLGFGLLEPDMDSRQKEAYYDAKGRNLSPGGTAKPNSKLHAAA